MDEDWGSEPPRALIVRILYDMKLDSLFPIYLENFCHESYPNLSSQDRMQLALYITNQMLTSGFVEAFAYNKVRNEQTPITAKKYKSKLALALLAMEENWKIQQWSPFLDKHSIESFNSAYEKILHVPQIIRGMSYQQWTTNLKYAMKFESSLMNWFLSK